MQSFAVLSGSILPRPGCRPGVQLSVHGPQANANTESSRCQLEIERLPTQLERGQYEHERDYKQATCFFAPSGANDGHFKRCLRLCDGSGSLLTWFGAGTVAPIVQDRAWEWECVLPSSIYGGQGIRSPDVPAQQMLTCHEIPAVEPGCSTVPSLNKTS